LPPLPQYVIDRLNTKPPAAIKRGNWYVCPLHCAVCMGYDFARKFWYWGITRQEYNALVKQGKIKHHDVWLDEEGICEECEDAAGYAELDKLEAEAGLAIERAYEEQDDYSPDYYDAQNNLRRALNNLMGYESPEQKRRRR
jgi:hypothetical protein